MPTAYSPLLFAGGPRAAGTGAGTRRPGSLTRTLLAAAAVGGGAFLLAALGGGQVRPARPILEEADRLAELAGFGIAQVYLSGHRMTLDSDIFAAMDLERARSLLGFDSAEARARIERLPWIRTAAISRIVPGTLSVAVVERDPFAVWSRPSGEALIDETGRLLAPIPAGSWAELPRVAGEGAPARAAEIIARLGRYPSLAGRVETAILVGQRRWTLRLAQGPEIRLPAEGDGEALAALMARPDRETLLGAAYAVVDLRPGEGFLLRPRRAEPAGGTAAAARLEPSG